MDLGPAALKHARKQLRPVFSGEGNVSLAPRSLADPPPELIRVYPREQLEEVPRERFCVLGAPCLVSRPIDP